VTLLNILAFYPLQISLNDMTFKKQEGYSNESVIIFVVFAVVIAVVIIILIKNKSGGLGTGSGKAKSGLFAKLALHRMASDIGLNNEQINMLDFVFKTDQVLDPEKSIATPSLLDRHFGRAYRVIKQTSKSDAEMQYRHAVLFSTRNLLESRVSDGLNSTRQLKDDNSVIFNNGKQRYEVSVLSTTGDALAVECPKNALGSAIKLQKGKKISVLFFTKNNKGFSFETSVTGYSTVHGKNALLFAHSNKLKSLSQRRFRRRQIDIASSLYLVYVEGSGKKQRLVVDKRRLTGNITDISVGGCSIKVKVPVKIGAKMKIELKHGDYEMAALGQVLRTNRAGIVTVIHIRFIKVSRKSMNIINALAYEYTNE
jgi:c-di-GMP-binding flagellar brake protein YcgR